MSLPITPVPEFPNVPIAPGVPPVLREVGAVQNTAVQLIADGLQVASLLSGPQWGLFTSDNTPAFPGETASPLINSIISGLGISGLSVADLEFRSDYRISTAPQEEGAFLSYNKVQEPFAGRVTYAVSGLEFARQAFIQQAIALCASLELLTLVMPEYQFSSCNAVHWGFRRTAAHGVSMILADIWVEQVRVTGTAAFANTKRPDGAAPVDSGTVQPVDLEPATASRIGGAGP